MTQDVDQDAAQCMTIGQVTERTGLSVHTLRFYERQGIFTNEVERSAGGHRLYTEGDVEWLLNCTKFRASGMPLATIRRFAALVRNGPGNEAERLKLLCEHQQLVTEKIDELTKCLDLIKKKVSVYEAELANGTANELWR